MAPAGPPSRRSWPASQAGGPLGPHGGSYSASRGLRGASDLRPGHGRRSAERDFAGGHGVLNAVHLNRRGDPRAGYRRAAAERERGDAQARDDAGRPQGHVPAAVTGPAAEGDGPGKRAPVPAQRNRAAGLADEHQPPRQRVADRRVRQAAHPLLQLAQRVDLRPALLARGQVRVRPVPLGGAELTVDKGRQVTSQVTHAGPPRLASARRGRRCSSAVRSWARPRWIRLRTVPSFTPRVAAISSYDRPSMSHSTTAARYSGARSRSAAWMSPSR